jgi:hypothetical protein
MPGDCIARPSLGLIQGPRRCLLQTAYRRQCPRHSDEGLLNEASALQLRGSERSTRARISNVPEIQSPGCPRMSRTARRCWAPNKRRPVTPALVIRTASRARPELRMRSRARDVINVRDEGGCFSSGPTTTRVTVTWVASQELDLAQRSTG